MGAFLYFVVLALVCFIGRSAASLARERRNVLVRLRLQETKSRTPSTYLAEKPVRLEVETKGNTDTILLDEKHALIQEESEVENVKSDLAIHQKYSQYDLDNGLPMFRVRRTLLGYSPSFSTTFGAMIGELSEEDKMTLRRELRQKLRVIIPGSKPTLARDAPPPHNKSRPRHGLVANTTNLVAPPLKMRGAKLLNKTIYGNHMRGLEGSDSDKPMARADASGVQTRGTVNDIRARTRGLQRVGVMKIGRLDKQLRAGTGFVSEGCV